MTDQPNIPMCSKCGERPAYSRNGRVFALCAVCGWEAITDLLACDDDPEDTPDEIKNWQPEYIGVEIDPGVVAHIKPDAPPETVEALRKLMAAIKEAYEKGEL